MTPLDALAPRWPEISALLDEALALPAAERSRWIDSLSDTRAGVRETLRDLLAGHARIVTADFLGTLPRVAISGEDTPAGEPAAGDTIGPYRLVSVLGRGGMGAVWLAERVDGQMQRRVALKVPLLAWTDALAQRLLREREILAGLEHPHIARLYDAGLDGLGRPYFAMEYVEGQRINDYCRERDLPLRARIVLLQQVCAAVAHAHSRLVVHRDLKPDNIVVTAGGDVRLLDFGIAKVIEGDQAGETALTQLTGRALTLDYASPEQICMEPLGTTTDVYSLGVVSYELLTGARPYRLKRGSAAELEEAIAAAEPPRASNAAAGPADRRALRGDLDAILGKALKKDPTARYSGAAAFADDLQRYLDGHPVLAQPDSRWYVARKFALRHRITVTAGAAVALALCLGLAAALWQAQKAEREAAQAEAVTSFLTDLIGSTDPDEGLSRSTTTVQMLLDARRHIEQRFSTQPEIRVRLLSTVGYALLGLGETPAATQHFEAAIANAERHLQPDHRQALMAHLHLGEALITAGRAGAARAPLAHALAGLRRIDDAPGIVAALRWTSRMHSELRAADAGIAMAQEAVTLARRRLGPAHRVDLLHAELELLNAMQGARRGGQLAVARRAYELGEALYQGRVVRSQVTTSMFYGFALLEEGDAAQGIQMLRSAYEGAKTLFGPDESLLGDFVARLAYGQMAVGDYEGALANTLEAKRIWARAHGSRPHPDIAFGLMYEGNIRLAQHRFGEAHWLLAEAARQFEGTQGPGSRSGAMARSAGALAKARDGDAAGAEAMLGAPPRQIEDLASATVTARLGLLRQLQGRSEEAVTLLRPAVDYVAGHNGSRFVLAPFRVGLADALVDLGRGEEASSLARSASAMYAATQLQGSPAQAEAWETLARAELVLGRAREARAAAEKATEFWRRFDPTAGAAARAHLVQAQALALLGEREPAAQMYLLGRRGAAAASRTERDRRLLVQTAGLLGEAPPASSATASAATTSTQTGTPAQR